MRSICAVVGMALIVGAGCAAEEQRAKEESAYSAARLNGKFREKDPIVQMLAPSERQAMRNAGMLEESKPGEVDANGDPVDGEEIASADGDADKSTLDKAGDAMMSVLTVGVTLGMMAAPYLLF